MSYEIFYDKQFVRVGEKFIPMVLCGSNNCYQMDRSNRGRRERNWFPWRNTNELIATRQELMDYAEKVRNDCAERNDVPDKNYEGSEVYSDERFGWFTSLAKAGASCGRFTYGEFSGIFKTGCDKALTLEQLAEFGVGLRLFTSHYAEEKMKPLGLEPIDITIKSTDVLLKEMERLEPYLPFLMYSFTGMWDDTPKHIRRKFFPKKKPEPINMSDGPYFYVNMVGYGYVTKTSRKGIRYTYSHGYERKFLKEKDVERYVKRLKQRFSYEFKVEKFEV